MERLTAWERIRRVNPYVWDGLLAVGVFGISILSGSSFYLSEGRGIRFNQGPGAAVVLAAACAPLVWRRRAPIGVLVVTAVVAEAYLLGGYRDGLVVIALAIAVYTAAAHRDRRPVFIGALPIALAAWLTLALTAPGGTGPIERLSGLAFIVVLPITFGRIAFNRRRRIERDLDRAARDAVAGERGRISRELHDVVAHAMGVMVVQAGAARVVLDRDPEGAAAALRRIEDTGRTGLVEMRRLLEILETGDGAAARAPQPGLERLDDLLETMRASGLPVEAMWEGSPHDLPPGVDLTAYRVVQEALTNALKHAGPAHARVVLRYAGDSLEVEIADDGRGPPPEGAQAPGHGLIGMRERVALFGGSLETGARPGGGFVVRARIPLAEAT